MREKNNIFEELSRMKNLFGYQKGKVISEQNFSSSVDEQRTARRRRGGAPQMGDDVITARANNAFVNYPCLASLPSKMASSGNMQGGLANITTPQLAFKDTGDRWSFSSDGRLWSNGVEYGTFKCSGKPNTVILMYRGKQEELYLGGDGVVTAKGTDEPTGKLAQVKELPGVTVTGKLFPLTYGRTNNKIKELQIGLGMPANLQTGKFLDKTEAAIKDKASKLGLTYDRATGVDKAMFDKLVSQIQNQPVSPTAPSVKPLPSSPELNVPSSATLPKGPAVTNASPEQLFNSLVGSNAIDSLMDEDGLGRRRIKYKGPEPTQEILTKVDEFLKSKGYSRIKQKMKGYGVKYVWENPSL